MSGSKVYPSTVAELFDRGSEDFWSGIRLQHCEHYNRANEVLTDDREEKPMHEDDNQAATGLAQSAFAGFAKVNGSLSRIYRVADVETQSGEVEAKPAIRSVSSQVNRAAVKRSKIEPQNDCPSLHRPNYASLASVTEPVMSRQTLIGLCLIIVAMLPLVASVGWLGCIWVLLFPAAGHLTMTSQPIIFAGVYLISALFCLIPIILMKDTLKNGKVLAVALAVWLVCTGRFVFAGLPPLECAILGTGCAVFLPGVAMSMLIYWFLSSINY